MYNFRNRAKPRRPIPQPDDDRERDETTDDTYEADDSILNPSGTGKHTEVTETRDAGSSDESGGTDSDESQDTESEETSDSGDSETDDSESEAEATDSADSDDESE